MKKILIAIEGVSNSGKTTTLKEIIKLLQNNPDCKSVINKADGNITAPNSLIIPNNGDLTCIFEVEISCNILLKIGVATGGDTQDIVSSNLDFFVQNNCNIMFSATKSKGQTVDYIHQFIDKDKDILFLPFYKAFDKEQHDKKLAKDIVDTVWKLVN